MLELRTRMSRFLVFMLGLALILTMQPASTAWAEAPQDDGDADESITFEAAAFQQIADALQAKEYAYLTETRLQASDLADDGWGIVPEGIIFQVDEGVASQELSVHLEDEADIFTLTITPLGLVEEAHVKVDVVDVATGSALTAIEFDIEGVGKKRISALQPQPLAFRLSAAEQVCFAEAAFEDAIAGANSGFSQEDVRMTGGHAVADLQLVDYPDSFTAHEEQGFDVVCSLTLHPYLEERYELADQRISVCAIAAQEKPADLLLNGTDGSAWLTEDVTATYAGHALSLDLDASAFEDQLLLDSAEGSHEGIVLYARDKNDGAITKIANVAYRVDKTAPALISFSVEGTRKEAGDAWFFQRTAEVTVIVRDPECSSEETEDGGAAVRPQSSGLSEEDAFVEYALLNGQRVRKSGISLSGTDQDAGIMRFTIDGNQIVNATSFRVHVKDRAGNQLEGCLADAKEIPGHILRLVADAEAPQFSLAFDNDDVRNGSYFSAGRTGTFTITEANFECIQEYDPDQIIASMHEDEQLSVLRAKDFHEVGEDRWQAVHEFHADGTYSVEAQVMDLAGKWSNRITCSFIVDTTPPELHVAFDDEGAAQGSYFSSPRTATITVLERNFAADQVDVDITAQPDAEGQLTEAVKGSWTSQGDEHTCTVFFPGQGTYRLAVSGHDLALNPMAQHVSSEFTVDTIAPEVSIQIAETEAQGRGAYRDACPVSAVIQDANLDPSSSITLMPVGLGSDVNPYALATESSETSIAHLFSDPAHEPENDNVYRLEVTARDLAGNAASRTVEWSVNRFGSTFVLDDRAQQMVSKGYLRQEELSDIRICELNPSPLDDHAFSVSMTKGMQNITLDEGVDYSAQVDSQDGWSVRECVVRKGLFDADGLYQLTVRSADAAGNASMNLLAGTSEDRTHAADIIFTVDDTPPVITFSGFEANPVRSLSHEVVVAVDDNAKMDRAVAHVEGGASGVSEDVVLDGAGSLHLTLSESGDDQAISVEAHDAAGNMAVKQSPSVFVSASLLARWLHTPSLIAFCIVGTLAIGAVFLRRIHQRSMSRA